MSINNAKIPIRMGKSLRIVDGPELRNVYRPKLKAELCKHTKVISDFVEGHDKTRHAIEAVWRIYIPEKEFFTKKNTINEKCIDATNTVKIMEDALSDLLGIDDSQIIETTVRKIPTSKTSWSVCLELSRVARPEVVHLIE